MISTDKKLIYSDLLKKLCVNPLKIRGNRYTHLVVGSILILLIPLILSSLQRPSQVKAAWMDDNWAYRQTVSITNTGTAQTDYQISFTLDTATLVTAGKMRSNCNDIRITDTNGKPLPHWIQTSPATSACNQAATKIWTKAPSIPAQASGTTAVVYIYYGNPSAVNIENGNKVFQFFDDFSKSVDATKWTTTGSPTTSGGVLSISNSAGIVSNSTQSTNDQTKVLGFGAKTASTTVNTARLGYSNTNTLSTVYYNDDAANVILGPETTYLSTTGGSNYVGSYTFDALSSLADGGAVVDATGNNNDLVSVNGATILDPAARGKGLTLNGSTQNLKQKVYLSGTQNSRVDTAGSAAIDLTSLDTYTTASQPYAYMIVSTNCTTTGWGYLGAVISGTNLKVFSTKTGTTQNWATVPSGGTCNAFEVRKTDFQITGALSIGMWVKGSGASVIGKSAATAALDWGLFGDSGVFRFQAGASNLAISDVSYNTGGVWKFVVGVFDPTAASGEKAKIYIDGAYNAQAGTASSMSDTGNSFLVGRGFWANYWNGSIDSPFVLTTALSAAQVAALYHTSGAKYGVMTDNAATNTLTESSTSIDADTYHTFEITQKSTSSSLTVDGGTAATSSTNSPNSAQYIRFDNSDASNAVSVDWVYMRKTATTEPSASAATEEYSTAPIAYFGFDEGYGTTTSDASSTKLRGTIASSGSWQTEDKCVSGKCLYFDGSAAGVSIANAPILTPSDNWSVSFWSKIDPSQTDWQGVVNFKGGEAWGIYASHASKAFLYTHNTTTGAATDQLYFYNSTTLTPTNDWKFYTLTKSGTTYYWYINGKADGSNNKGAGDVSMNTTSTWTIAFNYSSIYKGYIDELKVYRYARSAAQVLTDYNLGKSSLSSKSGTAAALGAKTQDYLSQGLVGFWKQDEATWSGTASEVVDSSGNEEHGTAAGSTNAKAYPSTGKFGNGGYFDGVDDYIDTTAAGSMTSTTISVWVNTTGSWGSFVKTVTNTYNGSFFGFYNTLTPTIYFRNTAGTAWGVGLAATTPISTNAWHHVVAVLDGTNNIAKIYIDGAENTSGAIVGGWAWGSNNIQIGKTFEGWGSNIYYKGYLDEVRIYNRVLSPKEISDLYNWAPGPITYWDFEEGQGNTVYDKSASASANTGTWNGTGTHWASGKYGKAGKFNGTNDYLQGGNLVAINRANPFTVEVWFNAAAPGVVVDEVGQVAINTGWHDSWIEVLSGGTVKARVWNCTAVTLGTVAFNTWNHAVLTYTPNLLGGYLNGVPISNGSCTRTLPSSQSLAEYMVLGATDSTNLGSGAYFQGMIDEFKVYDYLLTSKQVISDFNAGHASVGSPVGSPLGYWDFDEGYGSTAYNSGNTGTANNETLNCTGVGCVNPAWTQNGKFGKALIFNGSNDLSKSSSTILPSGALTVSAWIQIGSTGTNYMITNRGDSSAVVGYAYFFYSGSTSKLGIWGVSPNAGMYSNTISVEDSSWHHVAVSASISAYPKFYLDGKDVTPAAGTNNLYTENTVAAVNSYPFEIGGRTRLSVINEGLVGLMDEVKVYNYALTADEIKLDYNRSSSMVLGSMSDTSGLTGGVIASNSASAEFCVPGDTSACSAPVGEWNFEEGSGSVQDTSGNDNTGTWNGTGSQHWAAGKSGKSGKFNGSDDYISLSSTSIIGTDTSFAIEAWVNINSASGGNAIYGEFTSSTGDTRNYFIINNGLLGFDQYNPSGGPAEGVTTLSTNTWNHVAYVQDGSNWWSYLNGKLETSNTNAETYTGGTPNKALIGARAYDSQPGGYYTYFNGKIDGIKIFNYARTASQIAWDYNRGAPIAYWDFDECQGTTLYDSSPAASLSATLFVGSSGTQTLPGTCATASTAWGNGVSGKRNYSLNFDGTDDQIIIYPPVALTNSHTISMWIYPVASSDTYGSLFSQGNSTGIYYKGDSRKLSFYFSGTDHLSSTAMTESQWHHIAIVNNAGSVTFYVDGKADGTTTSAPGFVGTNMANDPNSENFEGQIDDVKIYSYALTAAQVRSLYGNGAINFAPSTGAP